MTVRSTEGREVALFEADAFAPSLWAPLEWVRRHPRIIDILVILACTVPTCIGLVLIQPPYARVGFALTAAIGIALWWRRTHPLLVLTIVVACASMSPLVQPGFSPLLIETFIVVYTVASLRPLTHALIGLGLSIGIPFAAAALRQWIGIGELSPTLVQPLLLAALFLGIAVRSRRQQRETLAALVNTRIEAAAANERSRITAEMHDVVAHSVTVMIALAGGARAAWQKHPERATAALEQLGNVGETVLGEMQTILHVLRSGDSDLDTALHRSGHNLPTLEELADTFRATGLPVTLRQTGFPSDDLTLKNATYRIVQESLTNALRYADKPNEVAVRITGNSDTVTITVTDDGRPGPPARSLGSGAGLSAMAERAAALGGTHDAGPRLGGGWETRTVLPVTKPRRR